MQKSSILGRKDKAWNVSIRRKTAKPEYEIENDMFASPTITTLPVQAASLPALGEVISPPQQNVAIGPDVPGDREGIQRKISSSGSSDRNDNASTKSPKIMTGEVSSQPKHGLTVASTNWNYVLSQRT